MPDQERYTGAQTAAKTGSEERVVAFCAPVMNRLGDLQATLAHNLDVLRPFGDRVQLIIGCFDADDACEAWVRANFPEALAAGLLDFRRFPPLAYWHFSKAKNAFHDHLPARYYASLDGDNFISTAEVERLLDLCADDNRRYLVHHFSGNWGDGTSGRIAFPADLYRDAPYLEELLPRQFDEMGVILRLLTENPDLTFVSRPDVNIFDMSAWFRDFVMRNGISIDHEYVDLGVSDAPVNPRGEGYAQRDSQLFYFQQLNANYVLWLLSANEAAKAEFQARLEATQRNFVRTPTCQNNLHWLFDRPGLERLARSSARTLYAVNRDNFEFLRPWMDHYRELGVQRFVIVDDGSRAPLEDHVGADDVFVVRPRFATFRTSKVFWLRALMGAFQARGTWVLTADVDEFLDVPAADDGKAPLESLIAVREAAGTAEVPGLLVDMMPAPDGEPVTRENFLATMDWHYHRPPSRELGYHELRPVQWAFGDYWPLPLSVDIRYRLYGTVDCLRKVPLFRFDDGVDLNQGFHALLRHGITIRWDELLRPEYGLLPVRHYKLAKLFWQGDEAPTFERTEQYFGRTQENLRRIAEADTTYAWRCWRATPFKRRYRGVETFYRLRWPEAVDT